jgi:hypothetical protein
LGNGHVKSVPIPFGYPEIFPVFVNRFYDQELPEDLALPDVMRLFIMLELCQAHELSDRLTRPLVDLLDRGNPGEGFSEWICEAITSMACINEIVLKTFPGLAAARYDLMCEFASMPVIDDMVAQMWLEQPVEQVLHLPLEFLQAWAHYRPAGDRVADLVGQAFASAVFQATGDISELTTGRDIISWNETATFHSCRLDRDLNAYCSSTLLLQGQCSQISQ